MREGLLTGLVIALYMAWDFGVFRLLGGL